MVRAFYLRDGQTREKNRLTIKYWCLGPKKEMVDKTGEVGGEKILVVVLVVVVGKGWWRWLSLYV